MTPDDTAFPSGWLPESIEGRGKVVAGFLNPLRAGTVPNGTVIAIDSDATGAPDRMYVVWNVNEHDGEWYAEAGVYDLTLDDAVWEFTQRMWRFRGMTASL